MNPAPPVTQMVEPMPEPPVLIREFYQRTTLEVARDLLGKVVIRDHPDGEVRVRLTEVEAYLGADDPACHTYGGRRTARTETMWGEAGRAYVYLVYGIHHCLNVVTVGPGRPEAVLLRGAAIERGLETIRGRRGGGIADRRLTDGPGKLCQALAVTRQDDGADLCDEDAALRLVDDGVVVEEQRVRRVPRVGVDYAGAAAGWPLRLIAEIG
jgi:DNA-3-methyladenine glycosylase